ncbi:unnamed protein product, partial [Urochloa humidicola]
PFPTSIPPLPGFPRFEAHFRIFGARCRERRRRVEDEDGSGGGGAGGCRHGGRSEGRRGLDVFFVVYLLFCVGVVALMVMVSDNWWDPWPGVAFLIPICITTLWLTPKMKDVYIQLYATKRSPRSDSDLSTKLLAPEK